MLARLAVSGLLDLRTKCDKIGLHHVELSRRGSNRAWRRNVGRLGVAAIAEVEPQLSSLFRGSVLRQQTISSHSSARHTTNNQRRLPASRSSSPPRCFQRLVMGKSSALKRDVFFRSAKEEGELLVCTSVAQGPPLSQLFPPQAIALVQHTRWDIEHLQRVQEPHLTRLHRHYSSCTWTSSSTSSLALIDVSTSVLLLEVGLRY